MRRQATVAQRVREKLGLSRDVYLAWTSTIFAFIFFLATVVYSTKTDLIAKIPYVSTSTSRIILILRVLSECAGVFLGATMHHTFEAVQWLKISRPKGLRFLEFLALQAGTGVLGLMSLIVGGGMLPSRSLVMPRLLSTLRLISEVIVPVLGVLIMGNVNTSPVFHPTGDSSTPMAFGMGGFNPGIAAQLGVMEDLLFNMDYAAFLANPMNSFDITPKKQQHQYCASGVNLFGNHSCSRTVSINGALELVDARLLNSTKYPSADVLLSENQQVYILEFQEGISHSFDNNTDCLTISSGPTAYQLCLANAQDQSLLTRVISCPSHIVNASQCLEDTSWQTQGAGWSTSMRASFRNATVAYSRINNTILSTDFKGDLVGEVIQAEDMRTAFRTLLRTDYVAPNRTFSVAMLGAETHFFGRIFASHMYRLTSMSEKNPAIRIRGVNAVQSLLGLTLYYCQAGTLAGTVLPFSSSTNLAANSAPFVPEMPMTTFRFAETRYKLQLSRATLIAYILLGGITIALCFCILIASTFRDVMHGGVESTFYPALDFWTNCKVVDENKFDMRSEDLDVIRKTKGKALYQMLAPLNVVYRAAPGARPEGLIGKLQAAGMLDRSWTADSKGQSIVTSRDGTVFEKSTASPSQESIG